MDITSANSTITLTVETLFTTPQVLQKYSAEDIFTMDNVTIAETAMGLDGNLAAGYTPVARPQAISFMADSPSIDVFEQWEAQTRRDRRIYAAQAVVILPSISKKYTMTNGVLTLFPSISSAAKVLQRRTFTIAWESVDASPV